MKKRTLALLAVAGSLLAAPALALPADAGLETLFHAPSSSIPLVDGSTGLYGSSHELLHARLGLPGSFALLEAQRRDPGLGGTPHSVTGLGFLSSAPARRLSNGGSVSLTRASQLFEQERDGMVTVAYSWRGVTVEGSARGDTAREATAIPAQDEGLRMLSRVAKFSYAPLPGLVLRFSRGTWSRVDQLVSEGQVKRTSLAASYTRPFTGGEWQSTVAWGRNKHRARQSLNGYLAETSVRFAGRHLAFGRFEQVGSDEFTGVRLVQRDFVRVNKISAGYYQDMHRDRSTRLGVGLVASRHLLNASQTVSGTDPVSYMLFMRLHMN